jgi:hypothetical protein
MPGAARVIVSCVQIRNLQVAANCNFFGPVPEKSGWLIQEAVCNPSRNAGSRVIAS